MTAHTEPPEGNEHHFEEGEEAPPPGVRAMAIVRWVLLGLMILVAFLSIYSYVAPLFGQSAAGANTEARYRCPMHPQIVSDRPGECPICHMSLEPISKGSSSPSGPPRPPPNPAPAGSGPVEPAAPTPPGVVPVALAFDRVQAIGVRTAPVERLTTSEALRVTATVEAPDQGKAEVHARSAGFVEAIRVKQVGVKVKAGELLASIYSPEIYQAEQELVAMGGWQKPDAGKDSAFAPPTDAARRRLELLGLGKAAIDEIVRTGKASRDIGISAPIAGYVVRKNVVLGSRVTPEMALFEIADLAKVYVIANVYPHQLEAIHVGDAARFTTPALADRVFEAKVDLVYPDVDLATRTTRVRFQVDNKDLALRPGQFGTAELSGKAGVALAIPLDAVIDTGKSVYVFVVEEGGRYTPRTIEVGEQVDEKLVVRGGLHEGERVVSGATFMIDAESRLEAALSGASEGPPPMGTSSAGAAAPAPGTGPPSACDADFDRAKFPDKWADCKKCETVHRGMGSMEADCKAAIPKPWR